MKMFNAEAVQNESATALGSVRQTRAIGSYPAYVGLDVHKETIALAVARAGRESPESGVKSRTSRRRWQS